MATDQSKTTRGGSLKEQFERGEVDEIEVSDPWPGEECGRWNNGRLMQHCTKAGSEECEFECPYGSAA